MYPGTNYTANVSGQYANGGLFDQDDVAIWIDFNDNGSFEAAELVGSFDGLDVFDQPMTIAIPVGAALGTHRMRVMAAYNVEPGDMDPCNDPNGINVWGFGETHDYTVNIVSPCATPTALAASGITPTAATISWTGTAPGYEYVTDQVPTDPAGAGTPTVATTYTAGSLTPATTYYAHVRSACTGGSYSAWVTIQFTTAALPACNPVTGLSASNITSSSATLSWTAVTGATGYEYVTDQIAADPAGAGTATTNTTYNATVLNAATMYYAHVRTNCGGGNFSSWVTYSFTTLMDNSGVNNVNGAAFDVQAFPNPAKDFVTVKLVGAAAANGRLLLTDITGKELQSIAVDGNKANIDLHNLAAGVYMIKYDDDAHSKVIRITKQ